MSQISHSGFLDLPIVPSGINNIEIKVGKSTGEQELQGIKVENKKPLRGSSSLLNLFRHFTRQRQLCNVFSRCIF